MPTKAQLEQQLEDRYNEHVKMERSLQARIADLEEELAREVTYLQGLLVQGCRPIFLKRRTGHMTGPIFDTAYCPLCHAHHSPASVRYDPDGRPIVITTRPLVHEPDCYFAEEMPNAIQV